MNRIMLIQEIINTGNFSNYLEIGTQAGKSFLPIRCRNKMAVDPNFIIPFEKKMKWHFKNPLNLRNRYFEQTSDDFFATRKSAIKKNGPIDVALIDGLHTFRAALNDTLNTLEYLNKEGIIILHDCYPPNLAASVPAVSYENAVEMRISGFSGEWCGDVWKAIYYLRRMFPESLDAYVIQTDYGLGIVKIKNELNIPLAIDEPLFKEIDSLQYEDMIKDDGALIGLKKEEFAHELIKEFV